MNPTLVIPAFERLPLLQRLLKTLLEASYEGLTVGLVISVDFSPKQKMIAEYLTSFSWPHGPKEVVLKTEHLGLKDHILSLGNLSQTYGAIIMLEEDLMVGPAFYSYACKALDFYKNDRGIAGISLYHYLLTDSHFAPFYPLDDGSDVYFMKAASSWGQVWTANQWAGFMKWYKEEGSSVSTFIPEYLNNWNNSWKRYFITYLTQKNKYFVFPRASYTTHPADLGTNTQRGGIFQVPIRLKTSKPQFVSSEDALARYDAFFEPEEDVLKKWIPELKKYDFDVDLFGMKSATEMTKPLILTCKKGEHPIKSWGKSMVPQVQNLVFEVQGKEIGLYKREDLKSFENISLRQNYYHFTSIGEIINEEEIYLRAVPLAEEMLLPKAKELARDWSLEIAEEEKTKFIDRYHFVQRHSKISVCCISDTVTEDLERTLRSLLRNSYPRLEIIMVLPKEVSLPEKKEFQTDKIKCISTAPAFSTTMEAVLKQISGDIFTWIYPGQEFSEESLSSVNRSFKNFQHITWISGVPELSKTGLAKLRLNKRLFLRANRVDVFSLYFGGSVFVKTELLKKSQPLEKIGPAFTFWESVFLNLFEQTDLYLLNMHLLTSTSDLSSNYSMNEKSTTGLPSQKVLKSDGFGKKIGEKLLKPFFLMGIWPFSSLYLDLEPLPDVIHYDAENDSFYLSRF